MCSRLEPHALDLAPLHFVTPPVVQLGGAGVAVRRDLLGALEGAAVAEVDGDAGGAEGVRRDGSGDLRGFGPSLDQACLLTGLTMEEDKGAGQHHRTPRLFLTAGGA
jgi:hypothetical protein